MKKIKLSRKSLKISSVLVMAAAAIGVGTAAFVEAGLTKPTSTNDSLASQGVDINKLPPQFSSTIGNPDAKSFSDATGVKPLVPVEFNTYMPLISTPQGPVGFYGDVIKALDWFGALRWELDTSNLAPVDRVPFVNRAFINWTYDFANDRIWLLTNLKNSGGEPQKFVSVSGATGKILSSVPLKTVPTHRRGTYYFIQITSSGKLMAYNQGRSWDGSFETYDPATGVAETKKSNTGTEEIRNQLNVYKGDYAFANSYESRVYNILPVGDNRNLLVFQKYLVTTADPSDPPKAVLPNVGFVLVDDDLNLVVTDTNNKWSRMVLLYEDPSAVKGLIPTAHNVQKSFYPLLDGRIISLAANNVIVTDGNKLENGDYNFFKTFNLPYRIKSYSFDTFENLYFNTYVDSNIYKMPAPKVTDTDVQISTYYNLTGSSSTEIKDNARDFVLYNVPGYGGQIMLMNPHYNLFSSVVPPTESSLPEEDLIGLAAAITSHATDANQGDSKGLLNTEKAFQFSANFTIPDEVLSRKLPSEIVTSDLSISNGGFLTSNPTQNSDGTLRYPAFTKANINDTNGTFTLSVNLDQIPWFTDRLPESAIPLTITKVFNTKTKMSARVNFKDVNSDYDFRNTLPSEINQTDLNRFDPFQIDLTSQRVVNNTTGVQLFPKKEYSVTNSNNSTGLITVTAKYSYVPLGVSPIASNAQTFTSSKTYRVFSLTDTAKFRWTSLNENDSTTSIKSIASLKQFSESNILPSNVDTSNPSSLQQLLNLNETKGYPISKMRVTSTPNDSNGTFSVTLTLPSSYPYPPNFQREFTHTFTGFNKISDYIFSFVVPSGLTNVSTTPSISGSTPSKNYKSLLPSQVNKQDILTDFVRMGGFNGLDVTPSMRPDDTNGNITIKLKLSGKYPESVAKGNNFVLENGSWVSQITIGGFLTTSQYQNSYSLQFKRNDDFSLNSIKELEINSVMNAVNSDQGFTLNGITYKGLHQLANLFISSKGVKVPPIAAKNVEAFFDNQAGSLTFKISFTKEEAGGETPLTFVETYTGFVQGVATPTNDIFTFRNQQSLATGLTSRLPSEIEANLKLNPLLVRNYFVLRSAGQFNTLLQNADNFTLTINANDIFGTLSITITFKNVSNINTLKQYSASYNNFNRI